MAFNVGTYEFLIFYLSIEKVSTKLCTCKKPYKKGGANNNWSHKMQKITRFFTFSDNLAAFTNFGSNLQYQKCKDGPT